MSGNGRNAASLGGGRIAGYAASKGASQTLVQGPSNEAAGGIRVVGIAPG